MHICWHRHVRSSCRHETTANVVNTCTRSQALFREEVMCSDCGGLGPDFQWKMLSMLLRTYERGPCRACMGQAYFGSFIWRMHRSPSTIVRTEVAITPGYACAGGYVCNEGFLNGQLTVTRAIGDFNTEDMKFLAPRDRLKHCTGMPGSLRLSGPLTSGDHALLLKRCIAYQLATSSGQGYDIIFSASLCCDLQSQRCGSMSYWRMTSSWW